MATDKTAGTNTRSHSIEFLVSEFITRHLRSARSGRKRPEYAERILNQDVLPAWRGRDARTIGPDEVLALLDNIVDRGAPIMANRTAALLGQLFKFGIHRRIVESTPVQLLYPPGGKERPRERALSEAELKAFLTHVDEVHRREIRTVHVLRVLLLTGQRRGELALARWSDIDFQKATWAIPDAHAKAGRGHVVPLSAWAVEEFMALKHLAGDSAFVFPTSDGRQAADGRLITRSVARCTRAWKAHGVEVFTPHDLRRTCRTGLARLKVAPHLAERVLNHAQAKIAGTYDLHDYLEDKRDALEKWAAHLNLLQASN
ncbi:tyrosine-type recombinase/integrase [Steroidobacter sp.]|uniref:tyrosine-type recombinase/integrase n=1 Tax=Steroidobacter sp. TaxID=1978227 RepID=UPI0039C9D384